MSQQSQEIAPVLKAYVHDVRYLSALLRGVNFVNRATVTITERGLVVIVEEARTLLGTAYIFSDVFDEFAYNPEISRVPSSQESTGVGDGEGEGEVYNAAFEIPLNTLLECLNIFGTAGGSATAASKGGRFKPWKKPGDESDGNGSGSDEGGNNDRSRNRKSGGGRMEQFLGRSERKTSMRLTYTGAGYPLTLLIAEDATGPTTTCEIVTFEAEPHLELPFDSERTILKIILKSSWLRDALSELDPSCDKLTFIGNPPDAPPDPGTTARQQQRARAQAKPILRIEAAGTFGNTEMDYPNDRDVLESFECVQPVKFSYRFTHVIRAMRALQSSVKTSLRIDDEGLLSLQFLMPSPVSRLNPTGGSSSSNFIEFRCLALDDDT